MDGEHKVHRAHKGRKEKRDKKVRQKAGGSNPKVVLFRLSLKKLFVLTLFLRLGICSYIWCKLESASTATVGFHEFAVIDRFVLTPSVVRVELQERKLHVPLVDRSAIAVETPPFVIVVAGPPKVGKTTLIRSLIKKYTRTNVADIKGPITVVTGLCGF
jgi:hypothetical protein